MLDWFPDEWRTARRVDRKFFWAIMCTEQPDFVLGLINGARESRNAHRAAQVVQRELLMPEPEWIERLMHDNGFVPRSKLDCPSDVSLFRWPKSRSWFTQC